MAIIKHQGLEWEVTKNGKVWFISNKYLGMTFQGEKIAHILIDINETVKTLQKETLYDRRMIP